MSNETKKLMIPTAIVIAGIIIAGAIVYSNSNAPLTGQVGGENGGGQVEDNNGGSAADIVDVVVNEGDHIRGNVDAPVTIVEYSDFQCPFCARFHPTVKQILENYPDKVRWVYKHFPLASIHPEATPAAEASECAAEQGKFWEFADGLFDNQSRLSKSFYSDLAEDLGLNTSQFDECVSSRKYQDLVQANLDEGADVGVRGTPGSFVNGEVIPGAVPYNSLEQAVERALADL